MNGDSQPLYSSKHPDCVMTREASLEALGMVKRFSTNSWELRQGEDVLIGITKQAIFDCSLSQFEKFLDEVERIIKEKGERRNEL